jgi:hypothetical protein
MYENTEVIMTVSRLFQRSGKQLYSGIFLRFNPLAPIGGYLLKSGLPKFDILNEFRQSPAKLMNHVAASGDGLACMTLSRDKAEKHSQDGGFGANDPESYQSHQAPSVVATVDTSNLDVLHIKDLLPEAEHFTRRIEQEGESVAVIVLPTIIQGWYINEKWVQNPFYLSPSDSKNNHLFEQLETTFIEIMNLKADLAFNEKNPEAVEALNKYHSILSELAGGPKAFKEKLEKLKTDIQSTGYEMDSNSAKIFKSALSSPAIVNQPSFK